MKSIEFLETPKHTNEEHVSLMIFDPSSQRVDPEDVFLQGAEVKALFDRVFAIISSSSNIKEKIIYNRLTRVKMMLDLVKTYDNVILTKFVNKVWRRYGFFSHLGETFVSLNELVAYLPEYAPKKETIILARYVNFDDDDIESSNTPKDGITDTDDDKTKDTDKKETPEKAEKPAKTKKASKKDAGDTPKKA